MSTSAAINSLKDALSEPSKDSLSLTAQRNQPRELNQLDQISDPRRMALQELRGQAKIAYVEC